MKVVEGNRSRIQVFQGVVIRRQGGGVRETFTVRKVSFGVGVERTFPVHTPIIEKIELVTRGDVRRAKLYYLRDLRGKKAKIKEKRETRLARPERSSRRAVATRVPGCRVARLHGCRPRRPGRARSLAAARRRRRSTSPAGDQLYARGTATGSRPSPRRPRAPSHAQRAGRWRPPRRAVVLA